jgi:tetratricopeptide (TPR) repeat protein
MAIKVDPGPARRRNGIGLLRVGYMDWVSSTRHYLLRTTSIIAEATGERKGVGQALGNLGNAFRRLKNPDRALQYYLEALKIFQDTKDPWDESAALINLGNIYSSLGNTQPAAECYEHALLKLKDTHNKPGECQVTTKLADLYLQTGNLDRAIDLYYRAVSLYQESGNRTAKQPAWATRNCVCRCQEVRQALIVINRL